MTPIHTAAPDLEAAAFSDPILAAVRGLAPYIPDDFSIDQSWFGDWEGEKLHDQVAVEDGFIRAMGAGARRFTHIKTEATVSLRYYVLTVDAGFLGEAREAGERLIGLTWWPGDEYGDVFKIHESGQFSAALCMPDGCQTYISGNLAPILPGTLIILTLIHYQQESAVYVDGVPVFYHDLHYSTGNVGFSLRPQTDSGLPSDVLFDNLRI